MRDRPTPARCPPKESESTASVRPPRFTPPGVPHHPDLTRRQRAKLADRPGSRSLERSWRKGDRGREGGRGRQRGGVSPRSDGRDPPTPTGLRGLCWCCSGAGGGPGGGAGALAVEAGRPGLPLQETPGDGSASRGDSTPPSPPPPLRNPPPSPTSWAPAGGASERWACADTPASRSSGPGRVPRRCTRPSSLR